MNISFNEIVVYLLFVLITYDTRNDLTFKIIIYFKKKLLNYPETILTTL